MRTIALAALLSLVLAACTSDGEAATTTTTLAPAPTTTVPQIDEPELFVNLVWHQHQPFYPKDADGVYTRPWVRVHATKDYWDMAAMLENYPEVTATFNLTPVLLLQLEDLANGAKDSYWVASEIPADELTLEEKTFIAERLFDVNSKIVARFPRLKELADARAAQGVPGVVESWTDGDFRDLQVLFNLAWTDPGFLAEEPLASLVAKERDYAEEDKLVLFDEHLRIIQDVIPLHARLWEEGRIEVTTTPLAHPILPLLADTNLALVGDPAATMPSSRLREIADADQQVLRGLDTAERLLGRRPTGMWPGEGAVAQDIMNLISKNGVKWIATGEDVLAKTLDIGSFERDSSDTVIEATTLYKAYSAQVNQRDPVAIFFRDIRLSDQIGFEYSGMPPDLAVDDLIARLRAVYESIDVQASHDAGSPAVVSVILDGENAWEHYDNDGIDFLNALYERLADTDWLEITTPSAYLEAFGEPEPIKNVFPASWFQPNYATWIGEQEEADAWDYLFDTRQDLRKAEQSGEVSAEALADATEAMLFAEGSDWFWWYGSDQDSGDDSYFDRAFRELLGQVYDALGQDRPGFVDVPIIPQTPVAADRTPVDLITIDIDGEPEPAWDDAGLYEAAGLWWAFDKENLYLRYDGDAGSGVELYIGAPQGSKTSTSYEGSVLGFGATHVLVAGADGALLCNPILDFDPSRCLDLDAAAGETLEIAVPLAELGALEGGNIVLAKALIDESLLPETGPLGFQVPDISDVEVFLDVEDPIGDDHGPGTYVYPSDGVFAAGSYDLTRFQAGTEGDEVVFTFEVVSPIGNPWGSPSGLSVQTFDVYIDTDPGTGTGARLLLPGRNAALADGSGWEYGVTIEGWQSAVFVASADGSTEETEPTISIAVFGDQGKVVVRVPKAIFGDGDTASWSYAVVVLSQEGFPSPGVRRVRDINVTAEQWRGGGAPDDINHTRIYDVIAPGGGEALLADYPAVTSGSIDDLDPDDFGQIPMVGVQ
ncbi:MAG: glucodextranase DOMON-like domain-containing protein [Actinomycetota bacterium]|nr:glucodextranase DOMON-like domain-containing protein [Actinomycetota bacterium]